MRAALVALALTLVVPCAASSAPAAKRADAAVFGGLGTWVDIYDAPVYAAPERVAAQIEARGVTVVWVETANHVVSVDVVKPVQLGRFVEALHARGIKVVGWYLPGHVDPGLDLRRSRALYGFRTPKGQGFDGIALNIEATKLKNVRLRSARAVALTRQVRRETGLPLAIVPFNPRGLERRPATWPLFPWKELAASSDAFAPMVYTGGAYTGFDATYGYVTRSLRLLRAHTGDPEVPIHVIGGVADRLGPEELAGFVEAVRDDGETIGASLYDWMTTSPRAWRSLARLSR